MKIGLAWFGLTLSVIGLLAVFALTPAAEPQVNGTFFCPSTNTWIAQGTVCGLPVYYCGSTGGASQACAKNASILPTVAYGEVQFNSALTQTLAGLPFTNANYSCSGSDVDKTTEFVTFSSYAAGSVLLTQTGSPDTDHIRYVCVGGN